MLYNVFLLSVWIMVERQLAYLRHKTQNHTVLGGSVVLLTHHSLNLLAWESHLLLLPAPPSCLESRAWRMTHCKYEKDGGEKVGVILTFSIIYK